MSCSDLAVSDLDYDHDTLTTPKVYSFLACIVSLYRSQYLMQNAYDTQWPV